MKLYVLGGRYLRTQDDAKARAKELGLAFAPATDADEVPTDARGLAGYLNDLVEGLTSGGTPPVPAALDVPLHTGVMIDEAFEGLPITHQLTLTCLALENARTRIIELEDRGDTPPPLIEEDFIDGLDDDDADEFI